VNRTILRICTAAALVTAAFGAYADGAFNQTDKRFATDAANAGVYQVQAAQVAAKRAQNPRVKAFAQRLIDEREKSNHALEQLAASRSMELPRELQHELRRRVRSLEEDKPEKVDREFVKNIGLDDSAKDIERFERARHKVTDPELKAFATKTLPMLREQRKQAMAIIGQLPE